MVGRGGDLQICLCRHMLGIGLLSQPLLLLLPVKYVRSVSFPWTLKSSGRMIISAWMPTEFPFGHGSLAASSCRGAFCSPSHRPHIHDAKHFLEGRSVCVLGHDVRWVLRT